MNKRCLALLLYLLTGTLLHAQDKTAFGLSAIYNFPLQTTGVGFRMQIPLANRVALVPQVKYMPSFNAIHEVYGGVNIHYFILNNTLSLGTRKAVVPMQPVVYLAAGVEYNRWLNYEITMI